MGIMKRSSYLQFKPGQDIELNRAGLRIWGHDTEQNFVCRLEINATGIEVFTGTTGRRKILDVNWEQFVNKLKA